ncbi:hypothetical protein [Rubinisphaera margarita]|uniref:hypothetical protein n=1 Tax=Rubinisphaera margarita TaxID=2909586 RepID=UPI001EE957BC|nr:hypothetical protein [Rubinisphaera margarita]MCG6157704.1 hypothetical protein [Rubinisphaera margarita]
MTQVSLLFHHFWHFDHCQPSNETDEANFHLFHGHIFALHPACGPFLLTPRGQEIVADYLGDRTESSRNRLLHALSIAIYYYSNKYEVTKSLRKNQSVVTTQSEMSGHIDALAEQERVKREEGEGIDKKREE